MDIFRKQSGVKTRWSSFENPSAEKGVAATENKGAKGHAFNSIKAGETKTLLDVKGSGTITRIWMTVSERTPQMLRSLRIDMYWDDAETPAVSAPLGDFFGVGLGRRAPFECVMFTDPEGRSFNCFTPMPFRKAARVTFTNESDELLTHLFYDINLLMDVPHGDDVLYFHAYWRRENPNELGENFTILPKIAGSGRFLGCNVGITANPAYEGSWWGEGEFKAWLDGDGDNPTLCGTGTEDYIGTAWGQGVYSHPTQGCTIADKDNRQWSFYRYHIDDPIFFDNDCRVALQTIGGCNKTVVIELQKKSVPLIPVSINERIDGKFGGFKRLMDLPQPVDLEDPAMPDEFFSEGLPCALDAFGC
ncbi:glycoside hydrolase family 172 protein, partial [Candidatus Hydrogenedentota bacterium]